MPIKPVSISGALRRIVMHSRPFGRSDWPENHRAPVEPARHRSVQLAVKILTIPDAIGVACSPVLIEVDPNLWTTGEQFLDRKNFAFQLAGPVDLGGRLTVK